MNESPGERDDAPKTPNFTAWVGVAFIIVVIIAFVNGAQTEETGILGVDGPERGWELPPFAAPLVTSELEGDANIADDDCEVDEDPCPSDRRRTAACEVDVEGAVRICDLYDRPLMISFWFTRGGECVVGQDEFDRAYRRHRDELGFLSVNIRDDRGEAREIVEERGWEVPVVHDRDGAVSNIYGVGVCPTVAYSFPGGTLMDAFIGEEELERPLLERRIARLIRVSERRAR